MLRARTVLILALRCELFSGALAMDIMTFVSCPVLITKPTAHCAYRMKDGEEEEIMRKDPRDHIT